MTKKEATFEESINELDKKIEALDSGDLSLEDSLKVYADGVCLLENLQKKLEDSQVKIEELMGKIEGGED